MDTDHSLRGSVTRDCPVGEHLDADIEVSGKLQLLDKLLLQIKELGLRVLILFQVAKYMLNFQFFLSYGPSTSDCTRV